MRAPFGNMHPARTELPRMGNGLIVGCAKELEDVALCPICFDIGIPAAKYAELAMANAIDELLGGSDAFLGVWKS